MIRQRGVLRSSWGMLAILAVGGVCAWGQNAPAPSAKPRRGGAGFERPEWVVQNALRASPLTAPYPIAATWRDGVVVLSGRVGTKPIHDAAVQLAIACGYPFRDDLIIDTAESFRAAMSSTPSMSGYAALAPNLSASYYVYPQPLFGRLDDPFFGMVPPLVSFPPWWRRQEEGGMAGPNGANPAGMGGPNGPRQVAPNPVAGPGPGPSAANNAPDGAAGALNAPNGAGGPFGLPPVKGGLEITVDATGQVFLKGVVASEEIAREIEQTAWSVPGVSRVVTQIQVLPRRADMTAHDEPPPLPKPASAPAEATAPAPAAGTEPFQVQPRRVEEGAQDPPPLPQPVEAAPAAGVDPAARPAAPARAVEPPEPGVVPAHANPPAIGIAALDSQRLTRRVVASLGKRPAVADQPIKVRSTGDAVMLTGKVPSAYEAMIAYRAAQQTPGARDVVDRLEFLVPDEDHPNPLVQRGRPEDLKPYLTAQIARHVGDLAHIDSVDAHGDHLEVRGTLLSAGDRDRVLAILRSIPVLRGFRLDPVLTTD